MVYLVNRMPIVLSWQVDLAVYRTTSGPEVTQLVQAAQSLGSAALQLTETADRLPHDVAVEREAAIGQVDAVVSRQVNEAIAAVDAAAARQVKSTLDQAFAGITAQREGIRNDIAGEEGRANAIAERVRGVVDHAAAAGRSINVWTTQTVNEAERSARQTLTYAFSLAVGLVLATLFLLLCYRIAVARWVTRAGANGLRGGRPASFDHRLPKRV